MDTNCKKDIAQSLFLAAKNNTTITPPSATYPQMSLKDAYEIQSFLCDLHVKNGETLAGKKIAFTGQAAQKLHGLEAPAFSFLFTSCLHDSEVCFDVNTMPSPILEPEIAFLLNKDLRGADITAEDVLDATEALIPAFEIVSPRVTAKGSKGIDKIADNAIFKAAVLGEKFLSPADLHLPTLGVVLEKNGHVVDTGAGAAVFGNPAASVAWLANTLAKHNKYLSAGEIVLSGCLTAMHAATAGDTFTAHFHALGSVSLRFS